MTSPGSCGEGAGAQAALQNPAGRRHRADGEEGAGPSSLGPSGYHPHSSSAPWGRKERHSSAHLHSHGGDAG